MSRDLTRKASSRQKSTNYNSKSLRNLTQFSREHDERINEGKLNLYNIPVVLSNYSTRACWVCDCKYSNEAQRAEAALLSYI